MPAGVEPARQRQSAAARQAAREALRQAGCPQAADWPLPVRPGAAPLAPAGHALSLAHCAAAAVAAVSDARWTTLGVDIEPWRPLPEEVVGLALASEAAADPAATAAWGVAWFGAKECVHKALHPLHGEWLEFDEVQVTPQTDQRFTIQPRSALARRLLAGWQAEGRWLAHQGLCLSLWALRRV
ncbi:MAG TPA: 4'-phosphopantetheinyl transferase superfamily protein [Nevskiaceae bacterium]|nr:4'-phosphopantetheinyl transferase superfamily protein [Nevskiaceae bacterium]